MTPETQSPDTVEAQAVNVALDRKALEAALVQATKSYAVVSGNHGGWADHFAEAIQVAIRAYLTAPTPALPQDVATITNQLSEAHRNKGVPTDERTCIDAYALILSQSAEIERLAGIESESQEANEIIGELRATIASAREVIEHQWNPLTCDGKFMTCPLPADETVVEVMLQDGTICPAWYSCNIMEMGDFDFMPVTADGEPDDEAESIADKVIAWRAARDWKER